MKYFLFTFFLMKRNDRAKADKKEEKKESEKNEDGTNPYIAVLNKKLRGLNKKLEKVKGTEAALREGKVTIDF